MHKNVEYLCMWLKYDAGCADLPPVKVLLVENLQNVSTAEAKPCFLAGYQVIMGWVVVKVTLYKGLNG